MSQQRRTPNHRLRNAMVEAGLTIERLAEQLDIDPKTVERWVQLGRTPYPANMLKTAVTLGVRESELWPDAIAQRREHDWRASDRMRELMSWVDAHSPLKEADIHPNRGTDREREPAPPLPQPVYQRRGRGDGLDHTR
ncbi:helix-turn-helix transcriptional regulator [Nocardia sp. NPDC005366]|uniref:helix-turn-helix domain-containing protein n=1 Tax=Nocardia sp. NPDC005366 TaxID=3156878 RepID=UPI0033AB53EF